MTALVTAVTALWLPMFGLGVLFIAACIGGRVWQAVEGRRRNPYLAPWSDRKPGDLS